MKPIVFLGGGRITGALLSGLHLARCSRPIIVHDRHAEKLSVLRKHYGVTVERDLARAVGNAGILIIAVRPASVIDLLTKIGPTSRETTAVSLAAGLPLANLREQLPSVGWARAMPSPACRTLHGLTALSFSPGFPVARKTEIRKFFGAVGQVLEIPESKFDAFTVTYSSSHGYHALATLAGAARKLGLDRQTALMAAAHALADGILAWRSANATLEALLEEAATPGGIAAAVMETMNRAGYGKIIERGLAAGLAKAKTTAQAATPKRFAKRNNRTR